MPRPLHANLIRQRAQSNGGTTSVIIPFSQRYTAPGLPRTRHESAFVKSRPGRRRRKSRPVSRRRTGRRSSGVTSTCGPMLLGTPPPTPHNPMLDTQRRRPDHQALERRRGTGTDGAAGILTRRSTPRSGTGTWTIPSPVDDANVGARASNIPASSCAWTGAAIRRRRARPKSKRPRPGLDPRGININHNGVVWTALAASMENGKFNPSLSPRVPSRSRTCSSGTRKKCSSPPVRVPVQKKEPTC